MAEDGLPSQNHSENQENTEDSDNEIGERPQQLRLDLGDDSSHPFDTPNTTASGSSLETQKRDDNPFSFKHFLRDMTNYQNKGARPKVYCEGRPVPTAQEMAGDMKKNRVGPELSSALPDFVQDHLVIEQCYLGGRGSNPNYMLDMNLPDFTPSRENLSRQIHHEDNALNIPLDLPRPPTGFPLDLPINNGPPENRSNIPAEVGNSKSLPDFLADSALCCDNPLTQSPEANPQPLQYEVDILGRQLAAQIKITDSLQRELQIAKNKENEYTQNLAKALEQVEENLEKSNRKAATSTNTIQRLKQEIKLLNIQINELKRENQSLRGEEAAGGYDYNTGSSNGLHNRRLAQELRTAASTAEHSLRQLLTGVDNLRIMAASLENVHRIEEQSDPFLDKDDSGPAL
ncbi:unnamed protein product [Brassicogethes aeneus]|uniref:Endosome-associated-trafficking regulator 1 n=1 Tax=Brassicogethes aeneus TaxID=1431903 RepID=A0A9P0FB50_BRAAE|nr:unnamed protein product [Brassicogethes aeneus]